MPLARRSPQLSFSTNSSYIWGHLSWRDASQNRRARWTADSTNRLNNFTQELTALRWAPLNSTRARSDRGWWRARGAALFFALDGLLNRGTEGVQGWVGIVPGVAERARIEQAHQFANFREFQQQRALRDQQADGQLDGRDLRAEVEFHQGAQEFAIALDRRPGVERNEAGGEREADGAGEGDGFEEIGAGMAFVEPGEDRVVERFDGAGDEGAVGALEDGEEVAVLEEVLDLDGDVVAEPGPLLVEGFDDGDGVAGAVEEIGVAKGDVGSAGGDLAADVLQDDIGLHDAEEATVDRDYGTVAAEVLAAARGF